MRTKQALSPAHLPPLPAIRFQSMHVLVVLDDSHVNQQPDNCWQLYSTQLDSTLNWTLDSRHVGIAHCKVCSFVCSQTRTLTHSHTHTLLDNSLRSGARTAAATVTLVTLRSYALGKLHALLFIAERHAHAHAHVVVVCLEPAMPPVMLPPPFPENQLK